MLNCSKLGGEEEEEESDAVNEEDSEGERQASQEGVRGQFGPARAHYRLG